MSGALATENRATPVVAALVIVPRAGARMGPAVADGADIPASEFRSSPIP